MAVGNILFSPLTSVFSIHSLFFFMAELAPGRLDLSDLMTVDKNNLFDDFGDESTLLGFSPLPFAQNSSYVCDDGGGFGSPLLEDLSGGDPSLPKDAVSLLDNLGDDILDGIDAGGDILDDLDGDILDGGNGIFDGGNNFLDGNNLSKDFETSAVPMVSPGPPEFEEEEEEEEEKEAPAAQVNYKTQGYETYRVARAVLRCHAEMKRQSKLPKINHIKYLADLAKLYKDSMYVHPARATIKRTLGRGRRVRCPPMDLITKALDESNPLPVFCRRPGEPITDWETKDDLTGSRATGWVLVLDKANPKFKLRLPDGDPNDICHVTQAKARQGCTTSNWASFEFVLFGKNGQVVCSVPLDKLREVIEMFRGNAYGLVSPFFL